MLTQMPWTATVLVFLRDQKGSIYPAAGTAVQHDRKVIRRLDRRALGQTRISDTVSAAIGLSCPTTRVIRRVTSARL